MEKEMLTKKCIHCGKEMPLSEFNTYSANKDGLDSKCRHCAALKQRVDRNRKMSEIKARGVSNWKLTEFQRNALDIICRTLDIAKVDVLSSSRSKKNVTARRIFYLVLRAKGLSYSNIAYRTGKDYGTVVVHCQDSKIQQISSEIVKCFDAINNAYFCDIDYPTINGKRLKRRDKYKNVSIIEQ